MNERRFLLPRSYWPLILTLLVCAPLLLQESFAFAQEGGGDADNTEAAAEGEETMFTLIQKGGWIMWPLGICSLAILTFALERLLSLRKVKTTPQGLPQEVYRRLPGQSASRVDREACAEMLGRDGSALAAVLRAGVLKLNRGPKVVEQFLTEAVSKQFELLKRRLRAFSVVASVAPLIGLLGTIFGMIRCFSEAGAADSTQRTQVLAEGIYAALVTTATGISIAIPAMLLYHGFLGKVDRITDNLEESASELYERYFGDDEPTDDPKKIKARSNDDANKKDSASDNKPPKPVTSSGATES